MILLFLFLLLLSLYPLLLMPRGIDLQPQDLNGRCDAYVQIHLGKKRVVRDSESYVPANLNPVFGKCVYLKLNLILDLAFCLRVASSRALMQGATSLRRVCPATPRCTCRCGTTTPLLRLVAAG
jgi:hypothetical protein